MDRQEMTDDRADIYRAKRALARELRLKAGFVGVGVADDLIRLYVKSEDSPAVQYFRSRYGHTYEGHSVTVILSTGFRTGSVSRSSANSLQATSR